MAKMKSLLPLVIILLAPRTNWNHAEDVLRIVFDYYDKDGDGLIPSVYYYWGTLEMAYVIDVVYGEIAEITAYKSHMVAHESVIQERITRCRSLKDMSFDDFKYLHAMTDDRPVGCKAFIETWCNCETNGPA